MKVVKMDKYQPKAAAAVMQLKVTLKGSKPPIWRRIQVLNTISLYKLHKILQVVMGWQESHLYEFIIHGVHFSVPDSEFDMLGGMQIRDIRTAELHAVLPDVKKRFVYVYDFGDDWVHELVVEKILPVEKEKRYPVCLAGERACPPEDCGGIWGFYDYLDIIKNPSHPDYEDIAEWMGDFNPDDFSVDAVNAELKGMR